MLGDVRDEGIDWDRAGRTHLGHIKEDDFLVANDIIIRSRGAHYGVVLASDPPEGTVVAAPLFLLSITRSDILPEYIAWYLNRPATHSILERMARGTSLPTISIRDLAEMEIPMPPLEVQQQIAEIARLLTSERDLSRQLIERRAQLADAILDEMARGRIRKKAPQAKSPTRYITFEDD